MEDKKREILAQVNRVNSDICYGCPIIDRYLELVYAQPEIVRCKDCDNKECWGQGGDVVCGIDGTPHRPDWFCADGELKEQT